MEPSITQFYTVFNAPTYISLKTPTPRIMQGSALVATVWLVTLPSVASLLGGRKLDLQISEAGGAASLAHRARARDAHMWEPKGDA